MKYQKTIVALVACLSLIGLTGCGKKATLKNGEETVVQFKNGEISADHLYQEIKTKYGINALVDMIDKQILGKKYKSDDKEEKSIDNTITQMKSQYENNQEQFLQAIRSYFGANNEKELREILSLDYKRGRAIDDWILDNIKESEINDYYERKTIGDMKLSHILIKPVINESMTEKEKETASEEAYNKAKELIEKLNNGEKFEDVAKEHSDDTGTAKNGGNLGFINRDNSMGDDFVNAAVALEKGKYTEEPVKTSYGYSIILKVEQKEKPKLKDVKKEIKETIRKEKLENDSSLRYEALKGMRKDNGLKFEDDELKRAYNSLMDQLIENAKKNNN